MNNSRRRLRVRLLVLLGLLAVFVVVAVSALTLPFEPAKWFIFAGAVLSGTPVVFSVVQLSARIGRADSTPPADEDS